MPCPSPTFPCLAQAPVFLDHYPAGACAKCSLAAAWGLNQSLFAGQIPGKEKGLKMRGSLCGGALTLVSLLLVGLLLAGPARAQAVVAAGKLVVDAPTLTAIGVEWKIAGDDNRNAAVEVSYRKKGETAWRQALPLLRI